MARAARALEARKAAPRGGALTCRAAAATAMAGVRPLPWLEETGRQGARRRWPIDTRRRRGGKSLLAAVRRLGAGPRGGARGRGHRGEPGRVRRLERLRAPRAARDPLRAGPVARARAERPARGALRSLGPGHAVRRRAAARARAG